MTLSKLKKDARKYANAKRKKANEWFFKTGKGQYGEGDRFIGISMPDVRIVAKKYIGLSDDEIVELLHSEIHEERMIALVIWTYQFEKADEQRKAEIYKKYLKNTKYINNWDLVDVTCNRIVGFYLLNKPEKRKILYKLAKSKDLWEKRIAIVSTSVFIVKKSEFEDTLKICEMLMKDKHDLMHKACGWMLREVGKKNEKVLCKFLDKYHKVMPRTMLRYSLERLDEEKRKWYMGR